MKKLVVVVVVLVLALVVAPWGVGKVAEKRLNDGIDKLVEQAPYLKVVDRQWTGGWFKSEQVVTFEAFSSWLDVMSPKVLDDAMKKERSAESGDATAPLESAGSYAAPAAEAPADTPPPPKPSETLRFTVRNEIWHGPVLGLSGLGIARVNTHFVMSDETRKKIAEIFGPKDPVEISTRIGFTGGATTTFKSEGRTIKPKDSKSEISWETAKLAIGYSRGADKYDMDGGLPKFDVKSLEDKTHITVSDVSLDGVGKRISGDLYDTDFKFVIDKIGIIGNDGERIDVAGFHYIVDTDTKGDFVEMAAKFGTGEIKSKQLTAYGVELKEVHYDVSVRRLHTETLAKIFSSLKEVYAKPLATSADATKAVFAPFKEQGAELLKYDPEVGIDRIGIATPEGDGYLKGVIKLKGATADDFGGNGMALIGKLHADLTIDVSEKMVQKFPNGSMTSGMAVDSGYVARKGDRLVCHIVFADGGLTINGKPQAIPALGIPAAGEGVRPAE